MPRKPSGMSTRRRDQKSNGNKESQSTSTSKESEISNQKTVEAKVETSNDDNKGVVRDHKFLEDEDEDEISGSTKSISLSPAHGSKFVESEETGDDDKDAEKLNKSKRTEEGDFLSVIREQSGGDYSENSRGETNASSKGSYAVGTKLYEILKVDVEPEQLKENNAGNVEYKGPVASQLLEITKASDVEHTESNEIDDLDSNSFLKSDSVEEGDPLTVGIVETEDSSVNLRLEMEANLRRQAIERLAEENLLRGIRLFCFPEVVKPDENVKIFLNRGLSTLNNEPDVLIMGAFNEWRWRSFTTRLTKTHLNGDWWSCKIHVPKEAYRVDFVFFNGQDVYDNNDGNDFSITVEGGMQIIDFENFLLEEKRREQEKLAKEQAERERLAEEQRRIEAEKAAIEADRAQAKEETAKKKEVLRELMAKGPKTRDITWYIEPSEFKCEDKVRLYYNKSSGPLSHAKDLWIHGGYNNWKDGLSIVKKLVRSERIDGDWWYAEGKWGCYYIRTCTSFCQCLHEFTQLYFCRSLFFFPNVRLHSSEECICLQLSFLIGHLSWIGFLLMVHPSKPLLMITIIAKTSMPLSPRTSQRNYIGLRKNIRSLRHFRRREGLEKWLCVLRLVVMSHSRLKPVKWI